MQTTSKMAQVMENIRKMPLFRQLVPQEAGIGWPIPFRRAGQVYITVPFFGMKGQGQGQTALYPPFATLTLDWRTQLPVEYVNLRFRSPWPENLRHAQGEQAGQVGIFPHATIANFSVDQYREQRTKLLTLYDELMDSLIQNQALSPAWEAAFSASLRLLIEPSLEPYYRVLRPKFFEHFLPEAVQTSPSV